MTTWHGLRSWWKGRKGADAAASKAESPDDFDCPTLSRLIRAACTERETTVWWVVVLGSSASVYAVPSDPRPGASSEEK
jgi:hypothetical protein